MKVLITGAFGNVGQSTVEALIEQGDKVRCFDIKTKRNLKIYKKLKKKYGDSLEVYWGDITKREDVEKALEGTDACIHLAFIIPKLSATGLESEEVPDLAYKVNVMGTKNLIEVMEKPRYPKRLIFTSSIHVYGLTQHLTPPRKADEPLYPIEHYSKHKVLCEEMVKNSNLKWCIFRLAACLPINLKLDRTLFDIALDNRMEFVHTKDVGVALARGINSYEIWGKILLIGGGPKCQYYYGEIVEKILEGMGIGMLPREAFARKPFPTDWMDTEESQKLLQYQQRTLDDYVADLRKKLGFRRFFIALFRPTIRYFLLRRSPYYRKKAIPLKVLWQGYLKAFEQI